MKIVLIIALILLTSLSLADIISGEIAWSGQYIPQSQLGELPPPETGNASFSFDISTQTGALTSFYSSDFSELLDGNYEFSVSSTAHSLAELTDFENIQWLIYEHKTLPDSEFIASNLTGGLRSDGQFYFFLTDEIFHQTDYFRGTFSVVPEPSTMWLLVLGGAVLFRKQKRSKSTHSITASAVQSNAGR